MASPTQPSDPSVSQKPKWQAPSLQLKWGPYFTPDPADEKATVETTVAAKGAGLITTRMGVEKISRIYGVENVDTVLADIEGEKAKADEAELAKTEATAAIGAKFAPPPKAPAPKKPKAPKK